VPVTLTAISPPILHLSEMAFREADMVLVRRAQDIRAASLDAEVVIHGAKVDRRFRLRNQLRAPHVAVSYGSALDCDFGALL
jgi:hypothetical protein